MEGSRRDLLKLGAATMAAGFVGGCAQVARRLPGAELPASLDAPQFDVAPEIRLLNRAGFGPTPGQAAALEKMGHETWIDRQLRKQEGEDLRLQAQLMRLDVLRIDGMELTDIPEDVMLAQFNQALLLRATYSGKQLFERLVDFWSNHFNIYARKGLAAYRKASDEREVVRNHALGNFPDMLRASAHSPAMLGYLDNQHSRKEAPNENYARELMELHTLGVHGGYSQTDVREVARCFTGWGIERRFLRPRGKFRFDPDRHDTGAKVVLGHLIPAGNGVEDGERVLDILARHPATAKFIASKICRNFLGDPDSKLVPKLENIYLRTKGDIPSLIKETLMSREFMDGPPVAKRPFDFVVSALRATGAESDCGVGIREHLGKMGQTLYEWPMPDGYPDGSQPWTGSLLARWNFAFALCGNKIAGTTVPLETLDERTRSTNPAEGMHAAILSSSNVPKALQKHADTNATAAALILSSPEFQWR